MHAYHPYTMPPLSPSPTGRIVQVLYNLVGNSDTQQSTLPPPPTPIPTPLLQFHPMGSPSSEELFSCFPPSYFPSPSMQLTPSMMGQPRENVNDHANGDNGGSDGSGHGHGTGQGELSLGPHGLSSLLSPQFQSPGGQGIGLGHWGSATATSIDGGNHINDGSNGSETSSTDYGNDVGSGDGSNGMMHHHTKPVIKRPSCHSWSYNANGTGKPSSLTLILFVSHIPRFFPSWYPLPLISSYYHLHLLTPLSPPYILFPPPPQPVAPLLMSVPWVEAPPSPPIKEPYDYPK